MKSKNLSPIVFETRYSTKEIINNIQAFANGFFDATSIMLEFLLEKNLTQIPERKAVWSKQKVYMQINDSNFEISYRRKVGKTFSDTSFGNACFDLCEEKVTRKEKNPCHLTSHESRNPKNGEWGGAIELLFHLITSDENVLIVRCVSSSSGLKEWEDAILELCKYKFLDLIEFEDNWVQEILRRIEESVKDDPSSRPTDITITEYAKKIFELIDLIDGKMPSNM